MGHADVADDAHGRLCRLGQPGDLARIAHAHFDHRRFGLFRQAKQGTGQTDLVVEVALGF